MDYFCSMESLHDQYSSFSGFMTPIIRVLEENLAKAEIIDREIMLKLLELVEHFVFRYNFNIQLSGYDSSSEQYSQPYTILEIKLLAIYEGNLETIISLIKILKSADILITQNLVNVLHRL